VEITIGIKNIARELTIQSSQSAEDLRAAIAAALVDPAGILTLVDEHDRVTVVPAGAIGFVQMGQEGQRRVGFGAIV
jgi:hypothetical protein